MFIVIYWGESGIIINPVPAPTTLAPTRVGVYIYAKI